MNRLMRKEQSKVVSQPAEVPADVKLLAEIRDEMTTLNKALAGRKGV
jgi:large-conductance mechanosensitive channel